MNGRIVLASSFGAEERDEMRRVQNLVPDFNMLLRETEAGYDVGQWGPGSTHWTPVTPLWGSALAALRDASKRLIQSTA